MYLNKRGKGAEKRRARLALAVTLAALALAGCGRNQGGPGGYQMPPPEVGVVTVAPESVALTTELPGRIAPVRVAQIRARVDGIVLHRDFTRRRRRHQW